MSKIKDLKGREDQGSWGGFWRKDFKGAFRTFTSGGK